MLKTSHALISIFIVSLTSGLWAAPDNETPPPPDPKTDSKNSIKGHKLLPPPADQLMNALSALEAACPGTMDNIDDCDIGIMDLGDHPEPTENGEDETSVSLGMGNRLKRVNEKEHGSLLGTHDADTIAVNFSKLSGAALGAVLWHELQHSLNAKAACTETDPTDGSATANGTSTADEIATLDGRADHLGLDLMDVTKACDIGSTPNNAGSPGATLEGVDELKEGVEIKKMEIRNDIAEQRAKNAEELGLGSISQEDHDELEVQLDEIAGKVDAVCEPLENSCDSPDETPPGGEDGDDTTEPTGGNGGGQ